MTKRWARWIVAAPALALIASAALACGDDAAADKKDPKDANAVAAKATKGCDMPCCARAKDGAEAKTDAAPAPGTPSATAAKKGHSKKKAGAAPTAQETPEPAPASSGTQL